MFRLYSCPNGVTNAFFNKITKNGGSYDEFVHLFGYKSRSQFLKKVFDDFLEVGILYFDTEITTNKIITYYRINQEILKNKIIESPDFPIIFKFMESAYIVLQLKGKN